MSYPWWYVPYLTSPMLIGIVAVIHVLVSQYAVGGGILLALENHFAVRNNENEYRKYWKSHAKFFILLTVVFGSITGVGIWWTIGLASPLATEELIRIFVFGWAIEWVFFVLELVAAFGFYYFWDKLPKNTHAAMGWIYAAAAWISLVLITGITAFMLNSRGIFGDWETTGGFWFAFFNLQFLPQTIIRTGISLILATFYVYMHITWIGASDRLREKVIRRMRIPSFIGVALMAVGAVSWLIFLPESSRMVMERAAAMNLFLGLFTAASAGIVLLLWLGPFRAPQKMNFSSAVSLFLLGIAAIGSLEFVREGIRKPFVIDRVVYGNQIKVNQSGQISRAGFLNSGIWTSLYLEQLQEKYPNLDIYTPAMNKAVPPRNVLQTTALLNLPEEGSQRSGNEAWRRMNEEDQLALGKVVFMHHCNDCHAIDHGYSAVAPMLTGKSAEEIGQFLRHINRPEYSMPPWCGNDTEAELLARFLASVRPEMPANITGIPHNAENGR